MTTAPFDALNEPLTVAPCSHDAARYAVMHWHYSRAMPNGKLVKVGVWEETRFVGAVVFGWGAAPALVTTYGLDQTEGCELVRVALADDRVHPTSKVVAAALRVLKQGSPGQRLVISFADEGQGHFGTLYQAGNWLYLGSVEHHHYRVNGRMVHPKSLYMKYGVGGQSIPWLRENVDPQAERVPMAPKHRYAMPLDRAMRRQLAPLVQPFPKAAA